MFTWAWRGCVIQRCQNKNPRFELKPGNASDVTHRKRRLGIWGFEKKQLVEFLPPNERVEIQSWVRPDEFVRYGRRALVGLRADDVKAVNRERLCLSLSSCRKTFKLKKVNKSFVPEPISCFRIPIYAYEYFMYIMSISQICILWVCYPDIAKLEPFNFVQTDKKCWMEGLLLNNIIWNLFFVCKQMTGVTLKQPHSNI